MPRARGDGLDFEALRKRVQDAPYDAALSPERARAVLEDRARKLAQRPEESSGETPLELLCFGLAGERYAVESFHVMQVLALVDLTRVPGAPAHLLGVTNLRGQVLPVFDLRVLLGISQPGLNDMSRLLVLGHDEAELGILADSVDEIIQLDPGELYDGVQPLAGFERACLRGLTRDALIVLNGAELLADRRLFLDDTSDERAQA
jgi:purine-binding chemotaxis protein CheW